MVDVTVIEEEQEQEAPRGMTETELAALVDYEVQASINWEDSTLSKQRALAIEYYRGEMNDTPHQKNRSSVVSTDLADTTGVILPGLMRIFGQADRIGTYEPRFPEDEPYAEQATDYINYLFWNECDGYMVLWDAFWDALVCKNGIIKHWWDDSPITEVYNHTGLSEDQFTALAMDPNVEVLAYEERLDEEQTAMAQGAVQMAGGPPEMAPEIYVVDCKIRKTLENGSLKVLCIPTEEFLISENATSIDEARFVGHRYRETRSELIKQGYDYDTVYGLPATGTLERTDEYHARHHTSVNYNMDGSANRATELVEIIEAYVKADMDGDGAAEPVRVVVGGPGSKQILDWELWEDETPFSSLEPERFPHRWQGRGLFDELYQIQRVKTVLTRQALDNLYATNNPEKEVVEDDIVDPDTLTNAKLGQIHRVKRAGTINPIAVPFTAQSSFEMLGYMDTLIQKRTGASQGTAALDPEALQNQSATAAMLASDASYSMIELIARNFAEMGLKRLFKCLLKIVCKHQDKARTIRLRNEWVEMDPRVWNSNMDVYINTGLGSGSRERDISALGAIVGQQEKIVASLGPNHPYSGKVAPLIIETNQKMVEAAGLKNPETYFPEFTEEDIAASQQVQSNPMDAKIAELRAEAQLKREEMALDSELERQKMLLDMNLKREEMNMKMELREEEMLLEAGLAAKKAEATGELDSSDINIRRQ